jgi:hypothetical protein
MYGNPRAPGVTAFVLRALNGRSLDEARAFLNLAGVAETYGGIHTSLATYQPPEVFPLRAKSQPFPERAEVTPLVAHMVDLVAAWDRLRKWKSADLQVDGPEQLQALRFAAARTTEALARSRALSQSVEHGEDFVAILNEGATAGSFLTQLLAAPSPLDDTRRAEILKQIDLVGGACSRCHRDYRN